MSYTPTEWQTGDTITAEKLNNMESGIENANNPFIVTLTPTAQDFSGTMDKTVAEINAAYEAGRRIVLQIGSTRVNLGGVGGYGDPTSFPSFWGITIYSNMLIYAYTGTTENPDRNTYATIISPLTPMS